MSEVLDACVLDAVDGFVVILDDRGGVRHVNRACELALGRGSHALVGQPFREAFAPAHRTEAERAWALAGTQRAHFESTLVGVDGSTRVIVWSLARAERNGQPRLFVASGTDVTERRRKEQAARELEQLYRGIVETSHDGVWVIDVEGNTLYANRRMAEMLGYEPGEFRHVSVYACMVPSEHAPFRARMERRKAGESQTLEWLALRKDGTPLWTQVTSAPFVDEAARHCVVGMVTDISERKRAEAALRESEQRYRNLVESAQEGIWVIDETGRTIYANRSMAQMLGYSVEEMIGRAMYDFMDDDARKEAEQNMERRRQGVTESHEFRFRHRDGSDVWTIINTNPLLDDSGRFVGALGMLTDITARRKTEAALRESEERFRLAVENSPDLMFYQDTDLRFTWLSKVYAPIRYEDVLGKTDADVVPSDQAMALAEAKRRVMRTGRNERVENAIVIGESIRYFETDLVRWVDAQGKVLGVAGYCRDVTARRQAEFHVRALNESLEQRVRERTAELEARSAQLAQSEMALRFSEERFRLIVEQSPFSVQVLSPEGVTVRVNRAFETLFGVRLADLAGYNILYDPQLSENETMPLIRRAFAGGSTFIPAIRYVPDRGKLLGVERWVRAFAYAVKGEGGEVREVVILHEDVTDQKIAEDRLRESERHYRELAERNRLLVQEVEHRVGNNLAGLIGLVSVMRGRARDADAFADALDVRLHAMARFHRMLVTAGWKSLHLRELVSSVLEGMRATTSCPAEEQLEGPEVALPPRKALPLMLIFVEWCTNSRKYGAHSTTDGRLSVRWNARQENGAQLVRLLWQERGGPPIPAPVTPSIGSELVQAFAERELGGSCTMCFPPEGAEHTIEFSTMNE